MGRVKERERMCVRCDGTGQICTNCGKSESKCRCRQEFAEVNAEYVGKGEPELFDDDDVEYIDCGLCDGRGSVFNI